MRDPVPVRDRTRILIAVRFGCWKNVVTAAGLVPPKKQKPLPKRQIFKEELRCQARERAYTEQQNSSE